MAKTHKDHNYWNPKKEKKPARKRTNRKARHLAKAALTDGCFDAHPLTYSPKTSGWETN